MSLVSRVLTLPDEGQLLVATDMQGNFRDFDRMASVFEEANEASGGRTFLVVTGDLVHGPELDRSEWPEYLGSYYVGDSARVHPAKLQGAPRLRGGRLS